MLFGRHEPDLHDRLAALPEEVLVAVVGAAIDPIQIKVVDDALDFAAGLMADTSI